LEICGHFLSKIITMNKNLKEIFKKDQKDRFNPLFNKMPEFFIKRDAARKNKIKEMFKKGILKTGRDYYIAAMIFHHGLNISDAKKAVDFSQRSFNLGYGKARWLYAAAIDRLLMKKKKKQKFGTQFFKKTSKSKWILYPIDPKTTDAERVQFNVPSLEEMKRMVKKLNRK